MKKLLLGLILLASTSSFAHENCSSLGDQNQIGDCKILYPDEKDHNDRFCPGGNFGVTYKGYFASSNSRPCFDSIGKAMKVMRAMTSCTKKDKTRKCQILYPGAHDRNGYHCLGGDFGVTYKGKRSIHGKSCFDSIFKAMRAMNSNRCRRPPPAGWFGGW